MTASNRLTRLLATVPARLVDLSDEDAGKRPEPGRWSKKEILGHLIDSAANNHQRVVRAQLVPALEFPSYEQEAWVEVQSYGSEPWPDLVNLWLLLNRHLLHVMKAIPPDRLSRSCVIGSGEPKPLSAVMDGYLEHLEHHLNQLLSVP